MLFSLPQLEQRGPAHLTTGQFAPHALGRRGLPEPVHNARQQAFSMRMHNMEQHNRVGTAASGAGTAGRERWPAGREHCNTL